ncbi:T9SS type A sorting domain-containing protein [Pedobacter sp. BS3]|nr:T9SS type A sorting domain-containing protein [Pedobacter sp. BS3]
MTMFFFFLLICTGYAQNTITLTPLPGGSEGDSWYTDASVLQIDASGNTSYYNSNSSDDWSVAASTVTPTGALNKTFAITFGGMASVNTTEGNDFGKMLSPAGIDRAAGGQLGIRGGGGNGIDPGEGFYFGLDLTNLNSTAAIQITKIGVTDLNAANETGMIVSRLNPSKRIIFGNSGIPGIDYALTSGAGIIDVSSFNLYVTGGEVNDAIVSVFGNSTIPSGFRITQVELKVLTNIFNPAVITNLSHPRLLLKQGEETAIQTLIAQSPEYSSVHAYIMAQASAFLSAPTLVYSPNSSNRILETSRDAIKQIFYLSYAYRMTHNTSYLTKAESVINTVCNFPDWVTYSLDVAEMCFAVSIGYDWLYNDLSATTRQKAREKILNYAFLTQKTSAFWDMTSNWNQVCISGLTYGALAILGDGTTQMDTEAKYILNRILIKNPNAMDTYANGNYQEGAMYWSYGTTYEVLMLSALERIYGQNHEGIKRLTYTPGFLESAEYMQYVTGTSSLYFNYSDCTDKRTPLPPTLWMAKKLNNPSILSTEKELMQSGRYASDFSEDSRFLPITLIYGKDISLDNLASPQSKLWYGYGTQPVALVRTAWQGSNGKYMGVKAGTPNYSHAHMDGGSFVYDSQGLRWTTDFGKEDYDAIKAGITPPGADNDFSQNSARWNIFRISNLSHNTLSIKKTTESTWQHHKANGKAVITETYDTDAKRGAKLDLKGLIGLNNELNAIDRSIYLVNNAYLEIKDHIDNGAQPINLYWNMATTALVETLSSSKLKLTQGGKTVELEVLCSNPAVTFTLAANRSTDPVTYFPSATYERKNPGSVMVGFEATIPANQTVTFTVKLTDGAEVPPSSVEPVNYILLELPNPVTGKEGDALYYDTSELHTDASGKASIGGISTEYAWNVYGGTDIATAMNKKFYFKWAGMGTTNTTTGANYGNLLTAAGIDRSATGELGIRGGASNGIDPNEGYRLGLNTLYLPETVDMQLAKIKVNLATGNRIGTVVNRNDTSKKKTFGGPSSSANVILSSGSGFVNVEDLNIILPGGQTDDDLASVFNSGSSGNIRVTGFVFKVIYTEQPLSIQYPESTEKAMPKTGRQAIIYPNPFTETLTLQNINPAQEAANLKLYNSTGTCILDKTYKTATITLDLQQVKTGVYIIQVTNSNGITTTKKLIKQ